MNSLLRFFAYSALIIALLLSICVFRTLIYFQTPKDAELCKESESHKVINGSEELFKRFADALRIKTVTKAERDYDKDALLRMHQFLEKSFPLIHSTPFIKKQTINKYSLLYTVKGSDDGLRPYMICAHLDVVPVEIEKWNVDPFAGQIKDGYIYGRGTIDDKQSLMAQMESLEFLLANGFRPKRSFYLVYGHDEEGSGVDGAAYMAKVLKYKIKDTGLEYLIDEGSMILNGSVKGVDKLVALISVTEKGYVSLKLEAKGATGHSSLPTKETAIVQLARALSKFNSRSFPSRLGFGVEQSILETLAPYMPFPYKLVMSNIWLFGPLVSYALSFNPVSNSFIRTSTAVTVIDGGLKPNVLPSSAYAIINHRIHPADSIKRVVDYAKKLINDESIAVSIHEASFEPHPVSPYSDDSFGYQAIRRSIQEVVPNTIVVPAILVASTDTKWYLDLTKNIYRFCPTIIRPEELKMLHGHNERISLNNYVQTINFYHHLMLISDNKELKTLKALKDEL